MSSRFLLTARLAEEALDQIGLLQAHAQDPVLSCLEADALEIMGINTKTYLILPKILASLVVIPALVIISAVLGIWGGRFAGVAAGILSSASFDKGLHYNFQPYNVFFAMAKAYTFAFIISSIPAYYGYYVKGGALEIGRASTKSVVVSCVLVLFADYLLAALLL